MLISWESFGIIRNHLNFKYPVIRAITWTDPNHYPIYFALASDKRFNGHRLHLFEVCVDGPIPRDDIIRIVDGFLDDHPEYLVEDEKREVPCINVYHNYWRLKEPH